MKGTSFSFSYMRRVRKIKCILILDFSKRWCPTSAFFMLSGSATANGYVAENRTITLCSIGFCHIVRTLIIVAINYKL